VREHAEAAERRAAAGVVEAERACAVDKERERARHVTVAVQHQIAAAAQAREQSRAEAQLLRAYLNRPEVSRWLDQQ